jgi:hypothetical protein
MFVSDDHVGCINDYSGSFFIKWAYLDSVSVFEI